MTADKAVVDMNPTPEKVKAIEATAAVAMQTADAATLRKAAVAPLAK